MIRSSSARRRLFGRPLASFLCVLGLGLLIAGSVFGRITGGHEDGTPVMPIISVGLLVVGGFLAVRRPANRIGWLVLLTGLAWGGLAFVEHYARYGLVTDPGSVPGATVAYWFATWLWVPGVVVLPAFLPLLFPDGRSPSRRWRPLLVTASVGLVIVVVMQSTIPWSDAPGGYAYPWAPRGMRNPLEVAALDSIRGAASLAGGVLLAGAILSGLVGAVIRFRRATGVERLQLRWVVFGVLTGMAIWVVTLLLDSLVVRSQALTDLGFGLALLSFPVSIAVAVLRYRLYDIDRIIGRTVTYVMVSLLLMGVYAVGVVTAGAVIRGVGGGGGGDLAVAASTLAVAAMFQPLRRRVQTVVDRRFNRSRFDAMRTVEDFAQRLRDEIDLDVLAEEVRRVAARSLQPGHAQVWLASDLGQAREHSAPVVP